MEEKIEPINSKKGILKQAEAEEKKEVANDESWCKNCQEVVYNFKQKKHCPKCGNLL